MININKLSNGNIAVYDAISGDLLRALSSDIVEIECNQNGNVKVIQDNGNVEYFDPANIDLINGVSFTGDCEALAVILATDIFTPSDFGNLVIVSDISDLPTPSLGIITTEPNKTYLFVPKNGTLDLNGNRIVCGGVNTFFGGSSETSYITSTGLSPLNALITSNYTLAMQFLTIADVPKAIEIDGSVNLVALDWTGVNFLNVPTIGKITTCDNFVYTKGAFLNSKGLAFQGTHGTIAFNNSLFSGDGLAGDLIHVDAGTVINRRFRIIYSSVVAFGLTTGINIDNTALLPNEAYILDTVNFSGGGTYLVGVTATDNKSLFINCVGIANSGDISQYYMNGNVTATTVVSSGVAYKVAGTTTSAAVTQKFINTNNRATYVGALTKFFSVTATLSLTSGNNHQIGVYIAKNGVLLPESEIYITTNGAGRAEAAVVQSLVQLTANDYIEIFVENDTSATNITVTDLNVIVI
jgi:hypothetical protein